MTTVLVTGVGAIIGYGVLRSLRASGMPLRLVGADIHADAVGQAWSDAFVQAPLTATPGYFDWLAGVIEDHAVDLVIPGIEQDLHRYSEERGFFSRSRARVVLNDARLVELSRDKWLMDRELASIGEPSRIESIPEGDFDTLARRLGLPFLLKPRRSYASKGLVRVGCEADFAPHAHRLGAHLIAQPVVGTTDEEYTVAVFGDGTGRACASIALRRTLAADGSTAKARTCRPDGLDAVVGRLCAHFRPVGPANLQFRRTDAGAWKLLEINPRVSSSTSIRTAFGYNEAAMCVAYFLHGTVPAQPETGSGVAVRYIEDLVAHDRDHL